MRHIKSMIMLAMVALLFAGCESWFEHPPRTFEGPSQVEFKPLVRTVSQAAGTVNINVQLIGPHSSTDTPVNFSVTGASTAAAGTHYNLAATSVVIPANSSFGTIAVQVVDGSVPAGEIRTVVIELADTGDVLAAENYKTFTLRIAG